MRFQDDFLQRIKDNINIVDIVSSYVPLKQKGGRYWGCCPFHQEKTPSFSVSADKGLYYCFGCHAAGDAISFIQRIEGLTFPEAVERLAQAAHIELPQEEMSEEDRKRHLFMEKLYEAAALASEYFYNCLTKTHMGEAGLSYFQKRHISRGTIDAFRLGFSPDQWDRLYHDFTEKKRISPEILMAAGLIGKKGSRCYDTFRNRCMFPILDLKGKPVAFGGRVMDDSKPKYLNSPETPIFNKRKLLFALYQALPEIRRKRQVIMVEGYMDAISLHVHGVTNAVASLGTAFTVEQAKLLKRYADEIIFSYDMDAAGQNATRRALDIAGQTGLKMRVACVGEGKDPDEFVNLHGGEAYLEAVRQARPAMDYLLDSFIAQNDVTSLEGKQKVLQSMLPLLVARDDLILIDSVLRKIARSLRLDEGIIRSEAIRYAKEHRPSVYISNNMSLAVSSPAEETREQQRRMALEEGFLRSCLSFGQLPEGWTLLREYPFVNSFHKKLFDLLSETQKENQTISLSDIESQLSREEVEQLAPLLMKEEESGVGPWEAYIRPLKLEYLKEMYRSHTEKAEKLFQMDQSIPENRASYQEEMLACVHLNQEIRNLPALPGGVK